MPGCHTQPLILNGHTTAHEGALNLIHLCAEPSLGIAIMGLQAQRILGGGSAAYNSSAREGQISVVQI